MLRVSHKYEIQVLSFQTTEAWLCMFNNKTTNSSDKNYICNQIHTPSLSTNIKL